VTRRFEAKLRYVSTAFPASVPEEDNGVAYTTPSSARHLDAPQTRPVVQVTLIFLALGAYGISAAQEVQQVSRVRAENPVIARAIAQGIELSTRFRRLIVAIDATDGLVCLATAVLIHVPDPNSIS
jgi:hypothetical protein